jgi:sugar fermentation stimulation protein A
MKWSSELVYGTLLERQKRFLARVKLEHSGEEVWAHCANPGSMKGNAVTGLRVWLQDFGPTHLESGKKLRYKWLVVEDEAKAEVCVDTSLGNKVFADGLKLGVVTELSDYPEIKPEVTVGDSRIDFMLSNGKGACYVEVKSVSMGSKGESYFPDSPTVRGQKHIKELVSLVKEGHRAVLFFIVMRADARSMSPARDIDPEYARLLEWGIKEGLEVLAYKVRLCDREIRLAEKIPLVI